MEAIYERTKSSFRNAFAAAICAINAMVAVGTLLSTAGCVEHVRADRMVTESAKENNADTEFLIQALAGDYAGLEGDAARAAVSIVRRCDATLSTDGPQQSMGGAPERLSRKSD